MIGLIITQSEPRNGYTYKELHLGNLLVNFLHELNDKVDQFVLQHLLGVEICYQERNVIALQERKLEIVKPFWDVGENRVETRDMIRAGNLPESASSAE